MSNLRSDLFIDGEWVAAANRFPVFDPATGQVLAEVADADVTAGTAAVDAAHAAFGPWAATPPRQRAEILRRAFEIMTAEAETCARIIVLENGKAWRDAMAETTYAAEFFRWFSEEASRIAGDFRGAPAGDKTIITDHKPIGVAVCITPWNFPAAMATRKIGPALAAGCTVVLKPAAETPLTALWIADVLQRAGVPAGVVNVVPTSTSSAVMSPMLQDARVRTLSFTGSTYVGQMLLRQSADRVLRTSMELGGNAPFLVLEGADVSAAVSGAMIAKMRNGGAACTAANRFYVHESLVADFTREFATALSQLKVGPGVDQSNDLGAMVSVKERDKILALVESAADSGVSVQSTAGAPTDGAFLSPLVVSGVKQGSVLTTEEIFGPVAPIVAVTSTDEAITFANDTEYGLISYVYAANAGEGIKVSRRLESGMVAVNRGVASDPAAPFGGMKQSGLGREGGFHGIHEFLEPQYLAVDLG
jgi:succinate-semialdehyde dehydrogenase/glutarate-semialdehyde dehydrogenase